MNEPIPIRKQIEDSVIQIGACPFCGQTYQMETSGMCTDEQLNRMAVEKCDCCDAMKFKKKDRKKKNAYQDIENLFGEFGEVRDIFGQVVNLIVEDQITSVTIKINGNVTGKISCTSKGNIKVEKEMKQKIALEG